MTFQLQFLPCDAMLAWNMLRPCVNPSICTSHSRVLSKRLNMHGRRWTHFLFSNIMLRFRWSYSHGAWNTRGLAKIKNFQQITPCISKTVHDRQIASMEGKQEVVYEWWHCQWLWMTLSNPKHPILFLVIYAFWVFFYIFGTSETSLQI